MAKWNEIPRTVFLEDPNKYTLCPCRFVLQENPNMLQQIDTAVQISVRNQL